MESNKLSQDIIKRRFSLVPFYKIGNESVFNMDIALEINCRNRMIIYTGNVSPIDNIELPEKTETPGRKDNLWENTCLELFIKNNPATDYYEFNLSPSRDYNTYYFSDYRRKTETIDLEILPLVQTDSNILQLRYILPLDKLAHLKNIENLSIGLSSVIKEKKGGIHYLSLSHHGEKPDFHNSLAFLTLNIDL